MHSILYILTRPEDELTRAVLTGQRAQTDTTVDTVDLTATAPDYDAVVEMIFSADSVEVW